MRRHPGRRDSAEDAGFAQRHEHKTEIFPRFRKLPAKKRRPGQIEIADAAVDKFGTFRASARTECVFLEKDDAQAAQSRVASDACPGNAAADDRDVVRGGVVCFHAIVDP